MKYRIGRREFVASVGLGAASFARPARAGADAGPSERKFFFILSLGRIGFKASFPEAVNLAARHGFEGLDPDAGYFAGLSDDELKRMLGDLKSKNLRLGAAGLPVEFRKDEATFNDGLMKLPAVAATLQKAGVTRISTWIMPCDDQLTYLQNFRQHAYRLRACAQILKDYGQKLGLEYVGPRTLWRSRRHPFVHTLSEIKELIVAIGTGNVGVQLDSWHWFNAEESEADILTLRNEDVVTVDLNDAPAGLTLDHQIDNQRELPGATGVIPIRAFLDGLKKIGYDGPIHAEPFNAALRAKPIDEACALTAAAMKETLAA
jgi:sugar phosphate isomerase/epimerase